MKRRISLLFILISMLFAACGLSTGKGTEQKEEEISVLRYDKLLSEYVRSNSFSAMQKLSMDYRQPTKILIEDVLAIGTVGDDTISQRLQKFYSDTTLVRLMADVETKFPNLNEVEKGLTKGFRKLKKEVPDTQVPLIYSQISAFNESIVLVDSLLGISLDKYMGEDYPLYKRFYYDYQCRSMRPERIVPDCFVFYLLSRYDMDYHEGTCLADLMMHAGKINYVVQHLLGCNNGGEAMGYSKEENGWCKENEKAIWEYVCSNGHLSARDPMVIRYYMKPAPAVEMFGVQAPSLIGTWIGTRIVAAYMHRHKDMKLKELLEFTDYHVMLSESGYLAS
ncbi:gliding motility lipoprotein GldB [uncultured Bacteroides sp.]|uniref:gliding motility protein GldB-related protein n=1 Tax=uncultured Bacteroides sp. TaxID=162156 RepID=UPI0025E1DCDD|nr:gliding motility lipoprotein GldB [uncultured Bacteroides sp.]